MTIAELLKTYEQSLTTTLRDQAFTVVGTLQVREGRQPYGGYLYADLIDRDTVVSIRLREEDRALNGRRIEVTGPITRRLWSQRGTIGLTWSAMRLKVLEAEPEDWSGPLRDIEIQRQGEWQHTQQDIEQRLRRGDTIRVLLILGTHAEVAEDILGALEAYASAYHVTEQRMAITDPIAIATALATPKTNADLIALVGGWGEWLRVLSSREVCAAVAAMDGTPIVSGVGHAGNHPLVEAVVHQAFLNPGLFGTWLRDRAQIAVDTTAQRLAQQTLQAREATRRATEAEARVQTLKRRQKISYVVGGVVAVVVILVVLLIVFMVR